jgi:hypothetical protein
MVYFSLKNPYLLRNFIKGFGIRFINGKFQQYLILFQIVPELFKTFNLVG